MTEATPPSLRIELRLVLEELEQLVKAPYADLAHVRRLGERLRDVGSAQFAVCVHCRSTFVSKRADALYCSDACRQAAYRARKAADG